MTTLSGASILVTGGTGSFGREFVQHVLADQGPARVVVMSRDELKQYEMRQELGDDNRVRFFLGDIRDRERLRRALQGVDYVVHAAALKQVDTAEYNPSEFIKTNVLGSENVIDASIDAGVKKVIALSTDKASSPVNLYGATKLTADKLFISSNHYAQAGGTRFSVVRYGNVIGSRGSVVPFFRSIAERGGEIPITDPRMTRFVITLEDAVQFVLACLDDMTGGELYVPRIPSVRVVDVAEAIAPGAPLVDVGIRPGEKLHEEMIAREDARRTLQREDSYVVQPTMAMWGGREEIAGEPVPEDFVYSSDTNDEWLSVDEIRDLLTRLGL